MEWTGRQQILFLLQSIGLGAFQGFALDVITGFTRPLTQRKWLWMDVMFGPMAAVCTFFGALVVMDGQLHPLLLFGVTLGMAAEHVLIGGWMCRILRRGRLVAHRTVRGGYRFVRRLAVACVQRWHDVRLSRAKR